MSGKRPVIKYACIKVNHRWFPYINVPSHVEKEDVEMERD